MSKITHLNFGLPQHEILGQNYGKVVSEEALKKGMKRDDEHSMISLRGQDNTLANWDIF
jgi:hypothetical protein